VSNSVVTLDINTLYPSSATYACNSGYVLQDSRNNSAICTVDSNWVVNGGKAYWKWNNGEPKCIISTIEPYPAPQNGYVIMTTDPVNANAPQANVYCFSGYQLNGQQIVYSQLVGSVWQWILPSPTPTCDGLTCPTETLANGQFVPTNGGKIPSTAFLSCNNGYTLSDTSKSVALCRSNSAGQTAWRYQNAPYTDSSSAATLEPSCITIGCQIVPTPQHGYLQFSTAGSSTGQATVTFYCLVPYALSTNGSTPMPDPQSHEYECQGTTWVDPSNNYAPVTDFPTCIAPSCGTPASLPNYWYSTTNNGNYPSTALYFCDNPTLGNGQAMAGSAQCTGASNGVASYASPSYSINACV